MAGEFGQLRWSGAVREAFLRGLAAHGSVQRACRETGMSDSGAYDLRRRDADFARLWDRAIARAGEERVERLAKAARPGNRMFGDHRQRHDGWTERRARIFLRALGETGHVREACQRAAISSTSAYRMRARDARFARAWARALAKARPTIEQAAFERAVEGWDEVVMREGREVSRRRRYSDSLLRMLLQRADQRAQAAEKVQAETGQGGYWRGRTFVPRRIATEEETNAALLKKLAVLKRQMQEKEERAAAARREEGSAHWKAEWERWKPGWDKPAPGGPQLRLLGPE